MLTQESANQRKQPLTLSSPTWARGLCGLLQESACPHGAKINGLSPRFCIPGPLPFCAKTERQNSCFSPKPCQVVAHARARVGKIRFFDHPYNPRMQEQFSASGGKAVKLGPTSMRSASPGPPSTCLKPRNTEIPLLPKSLSRGTARARARAKSRFFDHPYNPRMLTQLSLTRTNPGKAGAKPESGRASTLPGVYRCSRWPIGGLATMGRMDANCSALRCAVRCWMDVGGLQKLSRGKSRGTAGEPEVQRDGW